MGGRRENKELEISEEIVAVAGYRFQVSGLRVAGVWPLSMAFEYAC